MAFEYGKAVGVAFQLVDDALDFGASAKLLGKPNLNDVKSGLATAPTLYAAKKVSFLPPTDNLSR